MNEYIKRLKESYEQSEDPDIKTQIKAIISGITNFHINSRARTARARERYENHCKTCIHNKPEPIASLAVRDKEIPEISGRSCFECGGCILSYKLRQDIKPCSLWKETKD